MNTTEREAPRSAFGQGTQRDLEQIVERHQALAAGRGGVIVLAGPRGVGKGTILSELRGRLSSEGRLVLFGRAEAAETRPYAALLDPAAQALAFLETRGLAETFLDNHGHALGVLLPRLGSTDAVQRARDKTGFFEALRAFFIDLGRQSPFSLLLSDVHYADDDTRELIRFLAAHVFEREGFGSEPAEDFQGVLMLACRSDDDDGAAYVQSLCEGRTFDRFDIAGLGRSDLLRYLEHHPALDRLVAASAGRPEDIDELLEALPDDTDALLLGRIATLDQAARRALEALAVLGRPAAPDLLADILGLKVAEVARAMSLLVEERLIARRLQTGELLFTFARPHHLEVLLGHILDEERTALHHAIACALEARGGAEEGLDQLLAFHFLRGTEPSRGASYALSACATLLVTFAYGAAVELATEALEHAPDEPTRLALLGHLVEAHRLRGDLNEALASAEDMQRLAPPADRPKALRQLGELTSAMGDHKEGLALLEDALAALDDAPPVTDDDALPERALILAAMGEVAYAKGDLQKGADWASAALDAGPKAPRPFRLKLENLLGKVAYSREDFDEAERRFLKNLELAEEQRLDHEATLARVNTGLARYRRGSHLEAREILDRALLSARAVGDIHNEAHALLNLAVINQRLSDLGSSLSHFLSALALFSRMGNRGEVRRTTWNLANVYTAIGDHEKARLYLDQTRRLAEAEDSERGRAFVHFTEGDLAFDEGRAAAALTAYEKARSIFDRLGEASRVDEMTIKAAWAALMLGDVDAARTRAEALAEPEPGSLAAARRDAVHGAVQALGGGAGEDDASRGLAQLSRAIDEMDRHQAEEDTWRALLFLADRYEGQGDERSAASARERAQDIVTRCADRMRPEHREAFLQNPVRGALVERLPGGAPEEQEVIDEIQEPDLSSIAPPIGPSERLARWDDQYPEIVGQAPNLLRVFERLDRISRSLQPTVLIRGESGTGKELVAAAIHRLGERSKGPFIRVNCAALVETLLLSELFGHEKGSFTGAFSRKIGRFELARGGTIFLDEIGDISPKTQVSLLRVLQERSFERVGGTQTITTDAAVICATHRDLESMVADGSFREDLYYRLRGVVVDIPALRDRPEDITVLVHKFLREAQRELGRAPTRLSPEADRILEGYSWPGNIRELQNVVRSVALFCEGDVVEPRHLAEFPELFERTQKLARRPPPPRPTPALAGVGAAPAAPPARPRALAPAEPAPAGGGPDPAEALAAPRGDSVGDSATDVLRRVEAHAAGGGMALGDMKRRLEFEAIANAMRQTGGNITRAAALLKMKRPRLSQIVNGDPELKAIKEQSRKATGR